MKGSDDDEKCFHVRLNRWQREVLSLLIYKHGAASKTQAIRACITRIGLELGLNPSTQEEN